MPETRPLVPDQLLRSVVSGARMPLAASVGVSVLPSSVMSGMFLPDESALFQSVVRLLHGIQSTVTWDGTEPPIRQTVSVDGADADELPVDPVVPAALLELPELQPAMASAAAA